MNSTLRNNRPLRHLTVDLLSLMRNINQSYFRKKREVLWQSTSFDDTKGNFLVSIGEEIKERFLVKSIIGRGSYGIVVKAVDKVYNELVAIKIIRNRPNFTRQGKAEANILSSLNNLPQFASKVVKLRKVLQWQGHLCLVFELLSYNLYDLIKYTNFGGLSLRLVKKIAIQLCSTLDLFHTSFNPPVIHCDIKPENILLRHPNHSAVTMIDFGFSCHEGAQIFQYIQSRFYRSPEVILGISYGCAIDVWSLGCVLMELVTGKPLFDGADEMEQLHCFEDILGEMDIALIFQGAKRQQFYESTKEGELRLKRNPKSEGRATATEVGQPRLMQQIRAHRGSYFEMDDAVGEFSSFIAAMLMYSPEKRISPAAALKHAFLL